MESILTVLQFIGVLLVVLLLFNFMIIVHEWGHFLAARWRGLHIEKFQIWFGKPLWKKTYNGVQYGLGCIPAGGFVALPQMAPMDMIEGAGEERERLPEISPLDKIIVAFAGPLFSFLLACFFALIVWKVGTPVSDDRTTTIGYISQDMPAAKSDLRVGDRILAIEGEKVDRWAGMVDSVTWSIIAAEGDVIEFEVERDGEVVSIPVQAPREKLQREWEDIGWFRRLFKRKPFRKVGIAAETGDTIFGAFTDPSPATLAGLQKGDVLRKIDGKPARSYMALLDAIGQSEGKPISLEIERAGKALTLSVTPAIPTQPAPPEGKEPRYSIGLLALEDPNEGEIQLEFVPPGEQIKDSLRMMYNTITKVFSPKSDIGAGHLSGPVGIIKTKFSLLLYYPEGWRLVLWFSVVLNVNLAIMNMLPFPVLDGGHITMASMEIIRRKPLNFRFLEMVQAACVVLLMSFILFVTLKDGGSFFEDDAAEPVPEKFGDLPANVAE